MWVILLQVYEEREKKQKTYHMSKVTEWQGWGLNLVLGNSTAFILLSTESANEELQFLAS